MARIDHEWNAVVYLLTMIRITLEIRFTCYFILYQLLYFIVLNFSSRIKIPLNSTKTVFGSDLIQM